VPDGAGAGALGAAGAGFGGSPFDWIDSSMPSSCEGSLIGTVTAVRRQTLVGFSGAGTATVRRSSAPRSIQYFRV
jgi:hypothetical protein